MPLRNSFGRNPYFLYRRQGILGRIGNYIPQPLKAFAGVAALAAATVVLAPAVIILATPPLICGAWLVHKRRRAFAQLAVQLHHQRWQDLASFHLQQAPASEKSERIPTFARIAVETALNSNEQNLRAKLGPGDLQFSELEALAQDFSAATHGFAEKMSMAQYGLLIGGRKVGFVRVVQRQGLGDEAKAARARIEVQLLDGSLLVLKGGDHSSSIIEGHGHRVSNDLAAICRHGTIDGISTLKDMPAVTGGTMMVLDGAAPFMKTDWEALASAHGMKIIFCHPTSHEEFLAIAEENHVKLIVNSYEVARNMGSYSGDMIQRLSKLGVAAVCHEGAGYDVIGDVHEWKKYGVQVSNCPNSVAPDTANTGIYLTLSAMRNFYPLVTSLRAGNWRSNVEPGISPLGRTLGILGMGNIGRMYRDRARALGFETIQYHGRTKLAPELEQDSKYVPDLEELLATSDVLALVLPLNRHTYHLINREKLAKCKDGIVIVNIARGPIIDEAALSEALDSGKVRSVGLDVYEHEPKIHPGLLANPNITLLPHAGPLTQNTRVNLEEELFSNVKSFLDTGSVINLVPEMKN